MKRLLIILLSLACLTGYSQLYRIGQNDTVYVDDLSTVQMHQVGRVYLQSALNGYPDSLVATTVSDEAISLSWYSSTTNETGTIIERSIDNVTYTAIDTVTGTTVTSAGLTGSTRYYYRIKEYMGTSIAYSDTANDWTATKFLLTSTGTGAGVSTLQLTVATTNVTATLSGAGKFYTDAGGTAGESASWTITAGALRTIYLKVTSGTSNLLVFAKGNLTTWGSSAADGWTSSTNAASATVNFARLPNLKELRITGASALSSALPTGLTYLRMEGASIAWTYNGAVPTGLTYLYLSGASIVWTYNGAVPTGLTFLYLSSNSIAWTYNGALPTGLTFLRMEGASIAWTYNGALPTGLTFLLLSGASLDWTGLNVGNTGNIGTFTLTNYRVAKMSSADMVTLLTQMKDRAGTLPATVTINDYADYASPPSGVTDAVAALKTAKSITNVVLGQ